MHCIQTVVRIMLVELCVSNFLSFRKRQKFSLVKALNFINAESGPSSNSGNDSDLLPVAVIYGANASGKSNFYRCIGTIHSMVIESSNESQSGDELPIMPFMLDTNFENSPSEFEISIKIDDVIFCYKFSATSEQIYTESLIEHISDTKENTLFSRSWSPKKKDFIWDLGGLKEKYSDYWKKSTRPNSLFLSTAVQLNSKKLLPIFKWFQKKLIVAPFRGWNPEFTAKMFDNNKETVLKLLNSADVGIADIEKIDNVTDSKMVPTLPMSNRLRRMEKIDAHSSLDLVAAHENNEGEKVYFKFDHESRGTRTLFAYAGPFLDALQRGKTIVIDDFNESLHPKLKRFLIELFNNTNINDSGAQLIFSTHDTSLLNEVNFEADQIWFCEREQCQSTKLYSLFDVALTNKAKNLESAYLSGRFKGTPLVKQLELTKDELHC